MKKQKHSAADLGRIRLFLIDNLSVHYCERMNEQIKSHIENSDTIAAQLMWIKIQKQLNILAYEMNEALNLIK